MNQKSLVFLITFILKSVHNTCVFITGLHIHMPTTNFLLFKATIFFVITKPDSLIFTKSEGEKFGSVTWKKIYLKTHT